VLANTGQANAGRLKDTAFVLHFGDLSYAWSVGLIWELWQTEAEPIALTMPYMVSIGNHEYDHTAGGELDPSGAAHTGFHPVWGNYASDSAGECAVPVFWRFPAPPPTGKGIFWYSFDYGNAHIVQMSSEHDFTPGSEQYVWLDADLSRVNRDIFPWVIVTAHRPAYNSEQHAVDTNLGTHMAAALDDLLLQHRVHLFLAGHYHMYERTCAVTNHRCDSSGPVHITVGSAGAWRDAPPGYLNATWSMSHYITFGFANVRIDGVNTLQVDFWGMSNQTLREVEEGNFADGSHFPDFEVLDSVVIQGDLTEVSV